MKQLRTISLVLLIQSLCLLTACSDSAPETALSSNEARALILAPGISMPEGEGNQRLQPRRIAYYDGAKSAVYFEWAETDAVGIFPLQQSATQQRFYVKSIAESAETAADGVSKAQFKPDDVDFMWSEGTQYRAYYPYSPACTDITSIPLDYTGQLQTGKPDMVDYFSGGGKASYYATEKTASAHLSAKTFLLSDASEPVGNLLSYKMSHLGGIVRLYLALPQDVDATISEVRLAATKAVFHESAQLNVLTGETEPTGEATNNLCLSLQDVTLSGANVYGHYLVAYMMAYPVALSQDAVLGTTGKVYIYVKGKKTSDGSDVYFRSGSVSGKDIKAGTLTQFGVKPTVKDDPIEVQAITVQEWTEGLTLDNGGKGTEDW